MNEKKIECNNDYYYIDNEDKKTNSKFIMNSKLDLYKIPLNTILHGNLLNFKGDYFKKLYEEAEKEENKEFQNEFEIKKDIHIPNLISNIDDTNNKNDKNKENMKEEDLLNGKNEEPKKETKIKIKKLKNEINKKSKSDNILKEIKHKNINILNYNKSKQIQKNPIFKINKISFEIKYDTKMGENISVIGSIDKLGKWDIASSLNLNWNDGNIWKGSFNYNEDNDFDFEFKYILVNNGYVKEWENGINRKFIYQQIKSLIEPNLINGNIIMLKNIMNQTLEYDYNTYCLKIVSEWNIK